ncbi:MAG TPA: hypothetical protein VNL18_15240 [Gemmatimonadales bacterium]|nr:hypothetical protein [Gemmatimonadales bacterium]
MRSHSSTALTLVLCFTLCARATAAQTPVELIATGDSLAAVFDVRAALARYEAAAAADSTSVLALWKAAGAAIDVARQLTDDAHRATRDSLYLVARRYAERAVAADSLDADAHFMLAQAVGRLSRTKRGKERVRYGRLIYTEAARALALNPDHDGAHHVLGAWHAEVKRLSGFTRTLAKIFLGGGFLGRADWDSAMVHLERAVELRPGFIFHRLELARIYLDRDRIEDATEQLERILTLPDTDVMDAVNKDEARHLLGVARERRDRPQGYVSDSGVPTRSSHRRRRRASRAMSRFMRRSPRRASSRVFLQRRRSRRRISEPLSGATSNAIPAPIRAPSTSPPRKPMVPVEPSPRGRSSSASATSSSSACSRSPIIVTLPGPAARPSLPRA